MRCVIRCFRAWDRMAEEPVPLQKEAKIMLIALTRRSKAT
jgi:hypothetical protein